jgi:acetyltransferase-like isoleucine patch superfamily enzyme
MPPTVRRLLKRALSWGRSLAQEVGMIGSSDPEAARYGAFGEGSALLWPQGVIYNEGSVVIGEHTMIGPNTAISVGIAPGQQMVTDPVITIGSRCIIGRGSHIVGHWSITIGDDIQTGPYVYITDQNHVYEDPDEPIGTQRPVEAAVSVGSGSWLGANVVILPGTELGEHTTVAAGAVVSGRFPSRVVLAGVPARIVKRYVEGQGWVSERDLGDALLA